MENDLRTMLVAAAPLAVVSLIAFGRWLLLLRRRGGRVATAHLGVPDLIVTVAFGLFLGTLGVLAFVLKVEEDSAIDLGVLGRVAIAELLALGSLCGFLRFRKIPFAELIGWRRLPILKALGYAVLFLVAALPLVGLVAGLARLLLREGEEQTIVTFVREQAQAGHHGTTLAVFVSAALVAPLIEESFFRGYFYPSLKRFSGPIPAALITAALFALLHGNLLALAPLFLLALCFTVAYEWTGSLLVPFTMHLLFNATNILLMIQQVKPPTS